VSESLIEAIQRKAVKLAEDAADLATLALALDDFLKPPVAGPTSLVDVLETKHDARYPFPNWNRPLSQIRYMTIHHSAGQRATQNIQWWHRYHTQSKSWSRVGYHFGIAALEPGGPIELYQLNRLKTHSWHDSRNWDTFGVCLAGDLRAGHDERPNDVQLDAFGRLVAWLFGRDLSNWASIVGHKNFGRTACPGSMGVWRDDLIDAAQLYGCDISGMMDTDSEATGFAVESLGYDCPQPADYDEHEGLDGHA
jgi:hypothetical protein